ncbi:MAG TPA: DinB family protein [Pyrinomonadaceae bacterium]|nr:DinB family protein [Pyrinomonadaceae bacterium]
MENGLNNVASIFKANTDIINKAIGDVATEDWFRQPGDDSNHLLWLMGHLVVHRGRTLNFLGKDWDVAWRSLFARGAERIDSGEYPSVDELRSAWSQVSADLAAVLRDTPAEALAKAPPEGVPSFDGKLGGTVAFFAFHDTYHTGQVSYLRKWLGYGQTIG